MEHFLKHFKGSQNKPKMFKGEVIQNLFPKHNGNNLEINNRKRFGEFANVWKLKDTFLHKWVDHWAKQKFQRELGN